ncbi:MAG TPA: tetratricopeptide repeat protein [Candidatus Polarisedimenticolia bacterium]|nr:tetratricopeptide repeat protein [Candidatus Polarisedimenticolia bacterium]
MKLLLFLSSSLLTLLLVIHAVKARGARAAFLFFVPALLFGVLRGNSVAFLSSGEGGGPYIFSEAVLSIGRAELPACVGWVFALYLSWTLAEGILRSRPEVGSRVFPLASFGLLAMGCFSDAVETTASGVGWWRWNIISPSNSFLPGGTHLFGIVEWMSVGLDFLVPFLLFRTERGSRSLLAWASLALYPIHWATHWKYVTAPGFPHAYEIYHAIIVFAVPVFALLKEPSLAPQEKRTLSRAVSLFPALALAGMFAVLLGVDLLVLGKGELLISVLPLAVLAAGDRGREKALCLAALAGAGLAFGISAAAGRGWDVALLRMVPPLIPAGCLLLHGRLLPTGGRVTRRAYAAVLIAAAMMTGAGMIRAKREREEYSRLMSQAQLLLEAKNYAQAEPILKQAVAMKPNLNLGTKYLANAYGGLGRFSEAWRYAQISVDLNPADFEAYQLAGRVLLGQGQAGRAIPYYEHALMLNPGDSESARALAQGYSEHGRYADALRVLRRALEGRPEDTELAHLLGAVLIQTGEYREAHRVVSGLLQRAPEDPGAHLLMAFIQAAGGNTAAARREAERVLQLNPADPQARSLLESLPR